MKQQKRKNKLKNETQLGISGEEMRRKKEETAERCRVCLRGDGEGGRRRSDVSEGKGGGERGGIRGGEEGGGGAILDYAVVPSGYEAS